jgi:NAD(P)-dependent dehydrogenase (short-subunit alcohol dehydrogenase family)
MQTLEGKVVFVTGAARGIGRAIALELARRGARVAGGVRKPADAEELAAALAAVSPGHMAVPCDVSRYDEVEAAVAAARARFGQLDVLVNNAGVITPVSRLAEADPAEWAANITVNLVGAMYACRVALPDLLASGGAIINVSSGAASRALEGWSAYCAGKAGLAMLTQSLHLEYGPAGLRAYGLRPGTVDTEMQSVIRASGINEVSRIPRENLADPAGPARLVAWLCTAAAADMAGQEVDIRDPRVRQLAGLEAL